MRFSVALCTYNGARYIEEQIKSIIDQTLQVDEIVICDDGSKDETVHILNRLQKESSIPIRIFCNQEPIGVVANFKKAINYSNGEIIFLSDQDDIWINEKVKVINDWFINNSHKEAVFTNAKFIDSDARDLEVNNKTIFDAVSFLEKEKKWFDSGLDLELFILANRSTGATMAIRSCLKDQIIYNIHGEPPHSQEPYHDYTIALAALQNHSLGYIDRTLILYRIHNTQKCGFGNWLMNSPKFKDYFMPALCPYVLYPFLTQEQMCRVAFWRFRRQLKYKPLSTLKAIFLYKENYPQIWMRLFVYDFSRAFYHSLF